MTEILLTESQAFIRINLEYFLGAVLESNLRNLTKKLLIVSLLIN